VHGRDARAGRKIVLLIAAATWRGASPGVLAGGHDLTVVGKDSEGAEAVAADIGGAGTVKTAVAGEPIEGEVVVLAVYSRTLASPPSSTPTSSPGSRRGYHEPRERVLRRARGAARRLRHLAALAGGARWVKAFDTTFAIPLRAGEVVGHKLDVLIAGDDEDGRARSPQSPATAGSTRSTWAR